MISPEQLRKFAEACGYIVLDDGSFTTRSASLSGMLSDFLTSKDAVIEALDYFCEKTDWKITEIKLRKDLNKGAFRKFQWHVELFMPSSERQCYGESLNEAIIECILSAVESQEKSK